ncbi:MAG TPA: diaminopimelate epimerase [Candidatus Kapabacteria bacterium]|nr:diaminopimelate epimerase [Candidatus Kapabacteria bacterium]HPO63105.1 diaminopimelate epimerase [Candidatus Kapabacteria bacterium]
MEIEVFYMSGAGNLFTFIDNRIYQLEKGFFLSNVPKLCGAEGNEKKTDGVVSVNSSNNADFQVDFFNPDGSYGAMCGNGARCAIRFAERFFNLKDKSNIYFSQLDDFYFGEILEKTIKVFFPPPKIVIKEVVIEVFGKKFNCGFVDVGSKHIVINFEEIKNYFYLEEFCIFDINKIAIPVRNMQLFMPEGVNVNVYRKITEGQLELRTFEKGVEGETAACGTGTISTALISNLKERTAFPTVIIPKSKSAIYVDLIKKDDNTINKISLEGEAEFLETKLFLIDYERE